MKEKNGDPDLGIVNIIGDITQLDFSGYGLGDYQLSNLTHLPLSEKFAHLNLECGNTSYNSQPYNDDLSRLLPHPILQHLESLAVVDDLSVASEYLASAPHIFPNLHTLESTLEFSNTFHPLPLEQFPKLGAVNMYKTAIQQSLITCVETAAQYNKVTTTTPPPVPPQPPHTSPLTELTFGFNLQSVTYGSPFVTVYLNHDASKVNIRIDPKSTPEQKTSIFHALSQSPLLSNITTITIQPSFREDCAHEFIQSPFLSQSFVNIKHLNIDGGIYCREWLSSFLSRLETSGIKLESMQLTYNYTSFPMQLLATSPLFSQLKSWTTGSLHSPHLRIPDYYVLTDLGRPNPHLLWDATWKEFIMGPNLSNLTRFTAPSTGFHAGRIYELSLKDLVALLTSPMMSNDLTELAIWRDGGATKINDETLEQIFTARVVPGDKTTPLKFQQLKRLELSSAGPIGARGVAAIVQNLPKLTHLDLENGSTDDDAINELVRHEDDNPLYPSPALPNLTHLNLTGNSLTHVACELLSRSQLLDQLEVLKLSQNNRIQWSGMEKLLTSPLLSNMKKIEVSGYFKTRYNANYPKPKHCEIRWRDDARYSSDEEDEDEEDWDEEDWDGE